MSDLGRAIILHLLVSRRQKDNNLATVEYTKLAKESGVPVWDPQILRGCVFSIGTPKV